jgi:flagellar biosynthesis protein
MAKRQGTQASNDQEALRQVVALGYWKDLPAPKVLAQGRGEIAEAILARARDLDIPVKTDPTLVAFLMRLDLNDWVPPELFAAVAEVLAWAYGIDQAIKGEVVRSEGSLLPDRPRSNDS